MYCPNCGNRVDIKAQFCGFCGAALRQDSPAAPSPTGSALRPPAGEATNRSTSGRPSQKKSIMDFLIVPVALILILLGIGHMALMVIGRPVTAQVTGYEQVLILHNDASTRNPSRYKLDYQFAVNGKRFDGSVTRVFASGSHMRATLPVRYLPFWPHVNGEDSDTMGLIGPAALGVGFLLLVFRVRGRRSRN